MSRVGIERDSENTGRDELPSRHRRAGRLKRFREWYGSAAVVERIGAITAIIGAAGVLVTVVGVVVSLGINLLQVAAASPKSLSTPTARASAACMLPMTSNPGRQFVAMYARAPGSTCWTSVLQVARASAPSEIDLHYFDEEGDTKGPMFGRILLPSGVTLVSGSAVLTDKFYPKGAGRDASDLPTKVDLGTHDPGEGASLTFMVEASGACPGSLGTITGQVWNTVTTNPIGQDLVSLSCN